MSMNEIINFMKGKGTVKNYSSKTLWVVETDTNHPHGPAIAHLLGARKRTPRGLDADGFKRADGKSIRGHKAWWKVYGHIAARVYDYGEKVAVSGFIVKVPETQFDQGAGEDVKKVIFDSSPS